MSEINSILDPDLTDKLDELSITDTESKDAEQGHFASGSSDKKSSQEGEIKPVVKINTNLVSSSDIKRMVLSLSGFVPTASFTIVDSNDKMSKLDYPKDGDVISIYIRPKLKEHHRSIRMDLDIRNVETIPGRVNKYEIETIMKIPGLYADTTQSFPEDTSIQHLMDACEQLGLGFASNVDSTDDQMKRFMSNESPIRFIKDTTLQSYLNDQSFFTSFIDAYYYVNFVNVNDQFNVNEPPPKIMSAGEHNYNQPKGVSPDAESGFETDLVLTNQNNYRGTDLFIKSWGLKNQTADVWMRHGYKKMVQYFDQDSETYESPFVDPLTTDGAENDYILLKGRQDEDRYKDQVKHRWFGRQPGGSFEGVHDNYLFAHVLNTQNLFEIQKMGMEVTLGTYNTNLYRFQRVKVAIYDTNSYTKGGQKQRDKLAGYEKENGEKDPNYEHPQEEIRVEFLTGFYVISEIEYIYEQGNNIKQKLKLLRREWPIPGNVDQPQL